jgi:hypothetical protein
MPAVFFAFIYDRMTVFRNIFVIVAGNIQILTGYLWFISTTGFSLSNPKIKALACQTLK